MAVQPRPSAKRSNGTINNLAREDRSAHDWYRFVLSYPPHLVRDYLERFQLAADATVLDPFCGTGTTLVECKKLGLNSIGIEANPAAHFASSVKTDWSPDADALLRHAKKIAASSQAVLLQQGFNDQAPVDTRGLQTLIDSEFAFNDLPSESWKILLKDCISPLPLHKLLTLREQIESDRGQAFYPHERLAFARIAVDTASNLRFGPEIGVGKIKTDAPVVMAWLDAVEQIVADLECLREQRNVSTTTFLADARHIPAEIPDASVDAVITSPPYPNEKDYTRITRLESVLLGLFENKAELRAFKQSLIRSNTRNVYKGDSDDLWVDDFPTIQQIAADIEARRIELGKTSGFERLYARVTKLYFGGMARHLAELRRVLRPGAQLAYVVGDQASYLRVMIRTGQLLGEIAETLGYEVTGIDLFRTRLSTATREQLREEVVLLRWPGDQSGRRA